MTTIRRSIYAVLLASTTLTFMPSPASAQESARGHFTLTHEVLWGNAKVPAGNYVFSFDPQHTAPVLTLSKMSGARAGFIVLVPNTDSSKGPAGSRLVLASSPNGSYVTAMELPQFSMTLHFAIPSRVLEKQVAKASVASSGPGQ
jgi:hypothetical protein